MMRRTLVHVGAAALSGGALVVGIAGLASGQQPDPPGNNGTVKIDGGDFDDHPDNEPHVGCTFQVDFYGYDQGDLNASVTFTAVAPTSGGELLSDEVFIGEDPGGGGTDLDASATYDLTDELSGIPPHPEQGWHVRLDVHAEGSQGADTKHKVFWVSGCGSGPTTTSSSTTSSSTTSVPTSTTTSTVPSSTTTSGPSTSTTTSSSVPTSTSTTAAGPSTTAGPDATTSTTDAGPGPTPAGPGPSTTAGPLRPGEPAPEQQPTGPRAAPPAPTGELARTGAETRPLTLVAVGLIGLGATSLSERRRRHAAAVERLR